MSRWRSLRTRLLISYLAVAVVGAATLAIVAGWFAPTVFHSHVTDMGHATMMGEVTADLEKAFDTSLQRALVVAMAVGLGAALVVATIVARRILRPVDGIRAAARRLARGDYTQRVDPPQEPELAALAADVNTLAASLEATEQRRLRLIADVSHELRTPLSAIEGYMEGLIDGVVPAEPEVFASVAEEAGRLKRLAAGLAALSRLDEPAAARHEVVDLSLLVHKTADRLRPQFDDQGVDLRISVPTLTVRGDPDGLMQVLVNVLGNALGHTPEGGRVEVAGGADRGRVTLTVADTGVGIEPTHLDRIFERFYRAGAARAEGAGIGLTIARDIARAHGGDLTADSPGPGHGATFTLNLPSA